MRRFRKRSGAPTAALVGAGVASVVGGAVAVRAAGWKLPLGIGYLAGRVRQAVGSAWRRARGTAGEPGEADPGELSVMTRDELYERARQLDISGRSSMTKDELLQAVTRET